MEGQKIEFTELFRRWLIKIDMGFHVVAALLLLVACSFILYYALLNVAHPSRESIIHLVNDVLLALIILELLWTVIRFLKKQKFILGPFLAIGIIAAVRRILLIEAQTSFLEHVPIEKLYEIGLSAVVILILMVAYYLSVKAERLEQ
ncbi:MAG: phosphate-starvation-inducible PsiE family protein [Nitrospirae bacterium]|nr:phosphate-starvation-inducible PsiE family protein [Nitrospirota bacterium]MCL5422790.1 phosphate-starvation-inducible PsiE family protein [Nitrospirota bacterium]